ncbi:conserved hypothetical protein [Candida tropicalis MYA-3404]|uniref:Uncharacterized protein n=1 Tax=Candida tropicalis (strain ATCC MYA-3404 / T1) TaxID=294747 RepID=C5MBU3_CANTT|nr:conserved hypothetical protein [Candida tropicalis MYA-3404]EER33110.1 conserved hypothetical protein [Candida tropicalis MYA-3404]
MVLLVSLSLVVSMKITPLSNIFTQLISPMHLMVKHVSMRILKNLSLDKLMIMNQFVFMDIVKNSREESKMLNVLLINFLKMLKSLMILVNVSKSILNVMLDLSYSKREHMFVFSMLSKFLKCVNPRKN